MSFFDQDPAPTQETPSIGKQSHRGTIVFLTVACAVMGGVITYVVVDIFGFGGGHGTTPEGKHVFIMTNVMWAAGVVLLIAIVTSFCMTPARANNVRKALKRKERSNSLSQPS